MHASPIIARTGFGLPKTKKKKVFMHELAVFENIWIIMDFYFHHHTFLGNRVRVVLNNISATAKTILTFPLHVIQTFIPTTNNDRFLQTPEERNTPSPEDSYKSYQ